MVDWPAAGTTHSFHSNQMVECSQNSLHFREVSL